MAEARRLRGREWGGAPPPPPLQPPLREAPPGPLDFRFEGRAGAYFGIWIVNLLLTILTFGIWSAWAKVRRKRYFLGTTTVDGAAFDYLADGWTILKGRLIVLAATAVYIAAQAISPWLQGALFVTYFVLYPWIVNASLRFNARMTVWRNVRFDFVGSYWGAMGAFLAMPVLGFLSLGLLLPLSSRVGANYLVRHSRFGAAPFHASPRLAPFYGAMLQAIALLLIGAALTVGAIFLVARQGFEAAEVRATIEATGTDMIALLPLVMLGGFILATSFYRARVRNIVVNTLTLDGEHRFTSSLSGLRYAWIILSNGVLSILSLGLLHPWAAVRVWRYQAACLTALPAAALDGFVGDQIDSGAATGSEFVDLQGIEIGL